MKRYFLLLIFFTGFNSIFAQQEMYMKEIYFDSIRIESLGHPCRTYDGNFVLGGCGINGCFIMKLNADGNALWAKKTTEVNSSFAVEDKDSNLFFAGQNFQGPFNITKTNRYGDHLWSKFVFLPVQNGYVHLYSMTSCNDKGIAVAGLNTGSPAPFAYIFVAKFDSAGNMTWCNSITTGDYYNQAVSIKQIPNGDFILCGTSSSWPNPTGKATFMRIGTNGTVLWAKTDTSCSNSDANSAYITWDGAVFNYNSDNVSFLMKSDWNGNTIWNRAFTLNHCSNSFPNLIQTKDKGFLINTSHSAGPQSCLPILIKTDSLGYPQWGSEGYVNGDLLQPNDGFLVFNGLNGHIIKTDSLGNENSCLNPRQISSTSDIPSFANCTFSEDLHYTSTDSTYIPVFTNILLTSDTTCITIDTNAIGITEICFHSKIIIYPNPATSEVTAEFPALPADAELQLFNPLGACILRKSVSRHDKKITLDVSSLTSGIYYLRIGNYSGKLVKQ